MPVSAASSFVFVGSGTLISEETMSYYGVVVYRNVGSNEKEVAATMQTAASQLGNECVGYMYDTASQRGALIYDMSKTASMVSSFPPSSPPALAAASQGWSSPTSGDGLWLGRGPVSFKTSDDLSLGWLSWLAFAKTNLLAVTHVGAGTLLSHNNPGYYGIMQFRGIGASVEEVRNVMLTAITQAGRACVGFHMHETTGFGRYLEAALLYDIEILGTWPVPTSEVPAALSSASVAWVSGGAGGTGPVSFTGSVEGGRGWGTGWQGYAKFENMYDLGGLRYVGEGTLVSKNGGVYYGVSQYADIAESEQNLWSVIRRALLQCGDICVGFHYRPTDNTRYLQAGLLYDRIKTTTWPPLTPAVLGSARRVWVSGNRALWSGSGEVADTASVARGMGWNGWQAYALP